MSLVERSPIRRDMHDPQIWIVEVLREPVRFDERARGGSAGGDALLGHGPMLAGGTLAS
jgi:hypothetical protein